MQFLNKLSKIEFDTVSFNLNLQSVLNLCEIYKEYLTEQFWVEYFRKHKDYQLFPNYSLHENINVNIFIEELIRLNPNMILEYVLQSFVIHSQRSERMKFLDLSFLNIKNIPKEIGKLPKLKILNLDNNEIVKIPKEIEELANLRSLWLKNTNLKEFPVEIFNLTNLETLVLKHNQIENIPKNIEKLTKLKILDLSENQITEIPREIGKLTNLISLDLSENEIIKIPKEMGNFNNIRLLKLKFSHIFGIEHTKEKKLIHLLASLGYEIY